MTINSQPVITTTVLPDWTVNQTYYQSIAFVGGTYPQSLAVTSGSLPPDSY